MRFDRLARRVLQPDSLSATTFGTDTRDHSRGKLLETFSFYRNLGRTGIHSSAPCLCDCCDINAIPVRGRVDEVHSYRLAVRSSQYEFTTDSSFPIMIRSLFKAGDCLYNWATVCIHRISESLSLSRSPPKEDCISRLGDHLSPSDPSDEAYRGVMVKEDLLWGQNQVCDLTFQPSFPM